MADHVSRDDGLLRITLADLKRYLGLKGRYSDFTLFINPSCHLKRLENKVKATGKDKESHFEFEPGGGDGMDMLGQ